MTGGVSSTVPYSRVKNFEEINFTKFVKSDQKFEAEDQSLSISWYLPVPNANYQRAVHAIISADVPLSKEHFVLRNIMPDEHYLSLEFPFVPCVRLAPYKK